MMNIIPDAILPFVKELLEFLKEFKAAGIIGIIIEFFKKFYELMPI